MIKKPMLNLAANKQILLKGVLILLLSWGCFSFFIFSTPFLVKWFVLFLSLVSFYLILIDFGNLFLAVFLNFVNIYGFYGFYFTYNLPLVPVMIGLAITTSIIYYLLIRKNIVHDDQNLYVIFFLIYILEIFLALSYWLINPLSRSLIILIFVYIFVGYSLSAKNDHFRAKKFWPYLFISLLTLIILLLTVSWGR